MDIRKIVIYKGVVTVIPMACSTGIRASREKAEWLKIKTIFIFLNTFLL